MPLNAPFLRPFVPLLGYLLAAHAAHAAEAMYPPGSRLGLVPPPGMALSSNFFGFEDSDANAAITLTALPAEAYADLDKMISPDALKKQGMLLEKREALSLAIGQAFLMTGHQENQYRWVLVAASPGLTAWVTVQVPDAARDRYPEAAIRASLASLQIRQTIPVEEQLGLLPFKLTELAGFQVAHLLPGRAVVLSDAPMDAPTRSHILVGAAPGGPAEARDRGEFAREIFAATPNVRDVRITSSEPLRLAGQPVHEIMAQARDMSGSTSLKVVQWLRFGGGGYIQVVGITPVEAWPDSYPRFRAVRDGVALR